MSIHDLLGQYLESRGIPMPEITTGRKILEEGRELVQAIANGDDAATSDEIADVVLTAAVIAHSRGTTVEDCIRGKIRRDIGRGAKPIPAAAEDREWWDQANARADFRARSVD